MICISIVQESRRFALVDMMNAAKQCDLIEVRLDRFQKAAEIGELIANKPKPVVMSCRRPQDGGEWQGSEEERLALLRQCIISKADFVEIELDVADQIRKMPPAKRVISYTNFQETPETIADIHAQCQSKGADVVKLVTLARTPEEAWPLVQILGKATVPTVVVGLGKPGLMLTVLGRKIGAPFVYAALERGMESYPGQPTVADLNDVYHYPDLGKSTRLVGVTGFTDLERVTIGCLNAAFRQLNLPVRCLPLQVGSMKLFRKVIEAVKVPAVVVDEANRGKVIEIAGEKEPAVEQAQTADLILRKDEKWYAYNLLGHAATKALETVMGTGAQNERPLNGKQVMIVGVNPAARSLAFGVKWHGGVPIIASRDKKTALRLAQMVDCRYLDQFEAIYSTMHDVLAVCNEERQLLRKSGEEGAGLHPGVLKENTTLLDLTVMPRKSALHREAESRGCATVPARQVLLNQLLLQVRLIAGKEVAPEVIADLIDRLVDDEEV